MKEPAPTGIRMGLTNNEHLLEFCSQFSVASKHCKNSIQTRASKHHIFFKLYIRNSGDF
jgi:hypothetical protein